MITASIGYVLIIILITGLAIPNREQSAVQADKPKVESTLQSRLKS